MDDDPHDRDKRAARMRLYKSKGLRADRQQQRRDRLLERQSQSRRDLTKHLRSLQHPSDATHAADTPATHRHPRARPGRTKPGFRPWRESPLCLPEWLVDPPEDLGRDWVVVPRPDGKRCLVVACNGETTVRTRNGWHLRKAGPFQSSLPGGSRAGAKEAAGMTTVLDCVVPDPQYFPLREETLFVLDVMCWNDVQMYNCEVEFRFFWLVSRLSEVDAGVRRPDNEVRLCALPQYPATPEGLLSARNFGSDQREAGEHFVQDGLLLYNNAGHYALGMTPLVLTWKDQHSSLHWIETLPDAPIDVPTENLPLIAALRVADDSGTLVTYDETPVVCGTVSGARAALDEGDERRPGIARGGIYRFEIVNPEDVADGLLEEDAAAVLRLDYVGPSNFTRGQADSWSRIVFQCRARNDPLTIEQLCSAAAASIAQ